LIVPSPEEALPPHKSIVHIREFQVVKIGSVVIIIGVKLVHMLIQAELDSENIFLTGLIDSRFAGVINLVFDVPVTVSALLALNTFTFCFLIAQTLLS
jgi:hypothetical protein